MKHTPISYSDYLSVPDLLNKQNMRSETFGRPAHDEHLFIITHQTYELWFKQILFELDSVMKFFSVVPVQEKILATAVHRLERVNEILRLLIDQVSVLETMTALDFLDFRDMLYPASGFQSVQFRTLEIKLGLTAGKRHNYNSQPYHSYVEKSERDDLLKLEAEPSLFNLVDDWLARIPFLQQGDFEFWVTYKEAITEMFDRDKAVVKQNPRLDEAGRNRNLEILSEAERQFLSLFDSEKYEAIRAEGHFRLSYKAIQAALLISLYRDEPVLYQPYQIMNQLAEMDERMTMWRYRHALMAQRMLGAKIGTGGSSGHKYLKSATEQHRVFADFVNIATFFIPRSELPGLPKELKAEMGFKINS